MRSHFPDVKGELKSTDVLRKFPSLRRETRLRIRIGVKKVRIHIVDTLAYQARENQIYRDVLRKDPKIQMIIERARAGNEAAKDFLRDTERRIAYDIVYDSPSERLKRSLHRSMAYGYGYGLFSNPDYYDFEPIDLTPLTKKSASYVRSAAKYVAKEGSVFSEALEEVDRWGVFYGNHEQGAESLRNSASRTPLMKEIERALNLLINNG